VFCWPLKKLSRLKAYTKRGALITVVLASCKSAASGVLEQEYSVFPYIMEHNGKWKLIFSRYSLIFVISIVDCTNYMCTNWCIYVYSRSQSDNLFWSPYVCVLSSEFWHTNDLEHGCSEITTKLHAFSKQLSVVKTFDHQGNTHMYIVLIRVPFYADIKGTKTNA
jgi:hypothetical protein